MICDERFPNEDVKYTKQHQKRTYFHLDTHRDSEKSNYGSVQLESDVMLIDTDCSQTRNSFVLRHFTQFDINTDAAVEQN